MTTGAATHSLGFQCTCLPSEASACLSQLACNQCKAARGVCKILFPCFPIFTQVCGSQNSFTSNATLSIESTLAESWCKSEESGKNHLSATFPKSNGLDVLSDLVIWLSSSAKEHVKIQQIIQFYVTWLLLSWPCTNEIRLSQAIVQDNIIYSHGISQLYNLYDWFIIKHNDMTTLTCTLHAA